MEEVNIGNTEDNIEDIIINNEPSKLEIKQAMKKLKNNKEAGPGDIAAVLMKIDISFLSNLLHPIMQMHETLKVSLAAGITEQL